MKLGIVQGRLSPPVEGFQECPKDWEKEFNTLDSLGLKHIEWIVTKQSFKDNPLFYVDLSKYPISSVCADNLIDTYIANDSFLEKNLTPICEHALKNGIPCITIPLLEDSSMNCPHMRCQFLHIIKYYADKYNDLIFSFEIESHEYVIKDIIYARENFKLTYDTGNMTSLGIDHEYYIDKFHEKINNVHLKDRTFNGETVVPGKGKTDFEKIFDILLDNKYSQSYTIQTAREESGCEIDTIKKHMVVLKDFYHD